MPTEHNPVGWFEIPVKDLARAKAFYEHIFGVQLEEHQMGPQQMAWFPMYEGTIGAAGTLIKGPGYEPSLNGVLVYFTAPDIDGILARVEKKSGRTLLPKTSIGEYGFIGLFQDSEGNRIGLHSRK